MSRDPIPLNLPLDSEDFLRRACAACGREFKRQLHAGQPAPPEGGYACPYCGVRAPEQERFTPAQLEYANRVGLAHRLPELLERERAEYTGDPDAFVSELEHLATVEPLTEPDDMVRWNLQCHPLDAVKVAEDWDGNVGCVVCAQRT